MVYYTPRKLRVRPPYATERPTVQGMRYPEPLPLWKLRDVIRAPVPGPQRSHTIGTRRVICQVRSRLASAASFSREPRMHCSTHRLLRQDVACICSNSQCGEEMIEWAGETSRAGRIGDPRHG